MTKSFVHLHVHSEFSLLDSNLKLPHLVRKAREYNMPAVALTDHGSILGAVNFFKEARQNDIKPIIGSELYLAPQSRFQKPDRKEDESNYYHLLVLLKSEQGYKNLCELITASFLEGFYRKPRIDKELLEKHHEGLIVLSACFHGEIPRYLLRGRRDKAMAAARWYQKIFKDDFFIEIQNHYLSQQQEVLPQLVELAQELSIPLVATNDVHYLNRADADAREILICLQTNEVLSNPERAMKKETDEMYFKPTEEMSHLFSDYPEAIQNTLLVAARCDFGFRLKQHFLPEFQVPGKSSIADYFEKVCLEGFERIKHQYLSKSKRLKHSEEKYIERLIYEIQKIKQMGFPGYFLIVWDIIQFAKGVGIPVGPGRGSVVGSLVAFVMGITNIDPLEYDLIFERFLNPERVTLPDIDIDFDGERRDEIIEYIRTKYGSDNVAQIVTFGRMKAKLAIRDIGRVLEIPLAEVNRLAKMIPEGPKVELKKELEENSDLMKEIRMKPERETLIDFALKLENNVRHTSMHAAGVVIAPKKLTEFMPLYKTRDDITTHFEKEEVEEIGLLKMDILGLKTLTIIKNIIAEVVEREGIQIDLENINLYDAKTFRIFQKGDTDGIFQFESSGMREYLKRSKPGKIEDLIVLNALYRPGPLQSGMADIYVNRKIGKEPISFLFPELEEILSDTYGIIVFQEQVMQISVRIASFTMSEADELRKIMGKKQVDKVPVQEKKFTERALKNGFDEAKVKELFAQMKTFAEYGFNKSHSTAYAYLAYQTAYLKAHYPVYFMTAHLTSEAEKTTTSSKILHYISESKKMGLDILPPDINKSAESFRVESPCQIRFGLIGLKNVGSAALGSILHIRKEKTEFHDYADFISSIDQSKVNKSVLESLIKAGALDCFGIRRRILFDSLSDIIKQASLLEKNRQKNQRSLFGKQDDFHIRIPEAIVKLEEWPEHDIIQGEREIAGIYISHNPIEKFATEITKVSNTNVSAIHNHEFQGETVKLGGVVTSIVERKSKKGDSYGELFFEDLTGRIKVLAFKDRWEKAKADIKVDQPYFLEGRLPDNEEPNIYLESLIELETLLKKKARKVLISIPYSMINETFNEKLRQKLEKHKDSVPYLLAVVQADGYRVILNSETGEGLKATTTMKKDIEKLTGENSVEILF